MTTAFLTSTDFNKDIYWIMFVIGSWVLQSDRKKQNDNMVMSDNMDFQEHSENLAAHILFEWE